MMTLSPSSEEAFPATPQSLEKVQAIFIWQPQIENHQIEAGSAQQRVGLSGSRGMGNAEALGLEPGNDATRDECIVFCQQYLHGKLVLNAPASITLFD